MSSHCLGHGNSFREKHGPKQTNENHFLGFFFFFNIKNNETSYCWGCWNHGVRSWSCSWPCCHSKGCPAQEQCPHIENRTKKQRNVDGCSWTLRIQPYLKPALFLDFSMTWAHMCFLHLSLFQFGFCFCQPKTQSEVIVNAFLSYLKKFFNVTILPL